MSLKSCSRAAVFLALHVLFSLAGACKELLVSFPSNSHCSEHLSVVCLAPGPGAHPKMGLAGAAAPAAVYEEHEQATDKRQSSRVPTSRRAPQGPVP